MSRRKHKCTAPWDFWRNEKWVETLITLNQDCPHPGCAEASEKCLQPGFKDFANAFISRLNSFERFDARDALLNLQRAGISLPCLVRAIYNVAFLNFFLLDEQDKFDRYRSLIDQEVKQLEILRNTLQLQRCSQPETCQVKVVLAPYRAAHERLRDSDHTFCETTATAATRGQLIADLDALLETMQAPAPSDNMVDLGLRVDNLLLSLAALSKNDNDKTSRKFTARVEKLARQEVIRQLTLVTHEKSEGAWTEELKTLLDCAAWVFGMRGNLSTTVIRDMANAACPGAAVALIAGVACPPPKIK